MAAISPPPPADPARRRAPAIALGIAALLCVGTLDALSVVHGFPDHPRAGGALLAAGLALALLGLGLRRPALLLAAQTVVLVGTMGYALYMDGRWGPGEIGLSLSVVFIGNLLVWQFARLLPRAGADGGRHDPLPPGWWPATRAIACLLSVGLLDFLLLVAAFLGEPHRGDWLIAAVVAAAAAGLAFTRAWPLVLAENLLVLGCTANAWRDQTALTAGQIAFLPAMLLVANLLIWPVGQAAAARFWLRRPPPAGAANS